MVSSTILDVRRAANSYVFALVTIPIAVVLVSVILGWVGALLVAIGFGGAAAALLLTRMRDITNQAERARTDGARLSQAMLVSQTIARVSEERLAQLASAIREVFWMTNVEKTQMIYVSPACEAIRGVTSTELYRSPSAWIGVIHPSDRERVRARWVAGGADFTDEYRIVRPDGTVRWIHDKASPVRDAAGEIIAIAGIADDVTERRELEAQLRQTQKLESLGLLAGGVAHDFNNILGVITANANMLAETMPEGHRDRELVDEIDNAVVRAAALTRQLLAVARKQVTDPVVLDLNRSIADMRKMLRRLVGENVVVATSFDPDVGRVRFDPSSLLQILMNLAVNARDAMSAGGTLTISTRHLDDGDIALSVADTGCGMSTEVLARVFEPFFTTKPVGKGTGLGLPVVHGIVQQAGGRIEIESAEGVGTSFRVYLPSVEALADPILDQVSTTTRGQEKIVLVEDDCYVRAAAARALRNRGYTVLEASEGRAALRLLRDHKADVALLVTDIVMPGMNGRELSELVRERRPNLPILFMSGYADDNDLRRSVAQADVNFIEKPFRIQAFAAKVRQILDEADATVGEAEWRDSSPHLTQPINEDVPITPVLAGLFHIAR